MRKMRKNKILLTILLMGVAAIVAIPFLKECKEKALQDNKQDIIEKRIEAKSKEKNKNVVWELFKENDDVVGFVEIPGTSIKYPVMQTKDNPDFYLNHDFDKNYNFNGTPYLSAYCDIKTSDNLIIYGHNINGGRMFGVLTQYREKDFFENHKNIYFTTNQKTTYKIFAVMSVNKNEFEYWKFVMARDENEFNHFVKRVLKYSLWSSDKMPKYGEQLLTLSTCDNSRGKDYRFVVIGKKEIRKFVT